MATLNKETLVPLGLVGAACVLVSSLSMWAFTTIVASRFEPRFIGIEVSIRDLLRIQEAALDRRDFELWIERSRNLDPTNKFADPPR